MMKSQLLIIFTLLSFELFADATPKFHNEVEFEFWINGEKVQNLDSVKFFIENKIKNCPVDTLDRYSFDWDCGGNYLFESEGNVIMVERTKVKALQIFIVHEGNQYQSEKVNLTGDQEFFRILTQDSKLVFDHPLFYAKWTNYFISLALTILIELLFSLTLLKNNRTHFLRFILLLILVNCLSHPTLWYLDSHYELNIFLLELCVIVFEALFVAIFFRSKIKVFSLLKLFFYANLMSWWIGGIIYFIIKV